MGAARSGTAPETLPQRMRKAADTEKGPLVALTTEMRAGAEKAAAATLDALKLTQGRIRNAHGKIKRARFHAAVLALRWEGLSPSETADALGVSHDRVTAALSRMRAAASMDDQLQRLDQIAVPLAVDNLVRGVMDGDRQYTLKLLEGRGIHRTHKSVEAQITKREFVFRISTEMPAHVGQNSVPLPIPGSIVGAPDIPQLTAPAAPVEAE
jgi:hypothetical protein